jgi:TrpR family transcriptional regulator, trp operon repressor
MNKKLKLFIGTLLSIKSEIEMEKFLKGILTFKELEEIPTRLEIIRMLKKGMPQQKIASQLGVGVATVTRGSKELKIGRFKNI